MPSKVCAQRKGSMVIGCSPVSLGLRVIRAERLANKRKHGKLVRLDTKDKSTLRDDHDMVEFNETVACNTSSYKAYRKHRVTRLTVEERAKAQRQFCYETGMLERPVLSKAARRLRAKQLSVK